MWKWENTRREKAQNKKRKNNFVLSVILPGKKFYNKKGQFQDFRINIEIQLN